ncbi:MAG: sugar ABC transporter permease [Deinococcota bacterium]|jgi:putative chitobiose transport system permease protein|nr:sugar ABC transporter permease [Deinococcota bacterium]
MQTTPPGKSRAGKSRAASAGARLKTPRRGGVARKRALFGWLFVLPTLAVFLVFTIFPMIVGVPLALFDISLTLEPTFVGLKHFNRLVSDGQFWNAMRNSLIYLLVVPPIQILSITLAVLLNQKLPGMTVFRAMYYIPVITSAVAVAISWRWLYQDRGLLNGVLATLGAIHPLEPVGFLSDPRYALASVMVVTMWKGLGYYMVIYLAGLQSIPSELSEAAEIDGANKLQNLWYVTIPLLKPFVLLCSLMSTIAAIRVFDEVWVMTRGGPVNSTMVANAYLYKTGFEAFNFGYAAAVGLAIGIVVLVASVAVFIFNRQGGLKYY